MKKSDKHHAALPYAEAAAFMGELRKLTSLSALALEFTVITAARTSEVIEAKWGEIDLETALWVRHLAFALSRHLQSD